MKTLISHKWIAGLVLAIAIISFSAWKTADQPGNTYMSNDRYDADTIKPKKKYKYYSDDRNYKVGDLDQAVKELDKASIEMEKSLKIDFSQIEKDIKQAMEEIKLVDVNMVHEIVKNAMKEVELALKGIKFSDWEGDMIKLKTDMKEEMKAAKEELKAASKVKHEIDFSGMRKSIEKGMKEAREGIQIAKKEITALKEFVHELDKDGLIDKDKSYKIQIKNNKLLINGKEQSDAVNKKYSRFLSKEDLSISKEE